MSIHMKKIGLIVSLLVLSGLFIGITRVSPVSAAGGPTLSIGPASRPLSNAGALLQFAVDFSNLPLFQGYDIQVKADQAILNPKTIDFNGAAALALTVLANCVNGGAGIPLGSPGNQGCTSSDGPGMAHAAVAFNGPPSGNGLLFNVNYTAVSGPNSLIALANDQVSDGKGNPVTHASLNGLYGNPPGISISATAPPTIQRGGSSTSTVTIGSLPDSGDVRFSGNPIVTFSSAIAGISASPNPSTQTLSSGGTTSYMLTINVDPSVRVSKLNVTLTVSGTDAPSGAPASNSTIVPLSINPSSVGGIEIPTDKLLLLSPYLGLAVTILLIATGSLLLVRHGKHGEEATLTVPSLN